MIHPTFEHGTAMFMGKMMIDHENFRGTLLDKAICIWGVVLRHDHGSKLKEKNVSQCTQQNDIEWPCLLSHPGERYIFSDKTRIGNLGKAKILGQIHLDDATKGNTLRCYNALRLDNV